MEKDIELRDLTQEELVSLIKEKQTECEVLAKEKQEWVSNYLKLDEKYKAVKGLIKNVIVIIE